MNDIQNELKSKRRDELNIIARKLHISHYRALKIPELVSEIANCDENLIRKHLSITWWDRYHNHVYGVTTVIAFIASILFFVIPYFIPKDEALVLKPDDFQFRFSVISYSLNEDDIKRAPKAIPCRATLGKLRLNFDLIRLDALEFGYSRGGSRPKIAYNAENIRVFNIVQHPKLVDLMGEELRFILPAELRDFGGDSTTFEANLHIAGQWFTDGFKEYRNGTVTVSIDNLQ